MSNSYNVLGGSSFQKNPIVQSLLKNSECCEDIDSQKSHETKINELLINRRSFDALHAIRGTNGWAEIVTDKSMHIYSKLLREREGLHVLPVSTAGFIAMIDYHKQNPCPNDRFVVVLTGRKS